MRRQKIDLKQIVDRDNLLIAAHRAARGKRRRNEVADFFNSLEDQLTDVTNRITHGNIPSSDYRVFHIHDPKPRTIHAPVFKDRVIHHAIMNHIGPTLDRTLVDSSFACRTDKGALAAVHAAQSALRRHSWYTKIDISGYFDHIDHETLKALLRRRFKGSVGLSLLDKIIDSFCVEEGCGLPIGTLTSQHFANFYLDGADRYIREKINACEHVRYMDDIVWWASSRLQAKEQLAQVKAYLYQERRLDVKPSFQIQRSSRGLKFCGYRILPYTLRLTARRKRRYQERRLAWEDAWNKGLISPTGLQQSYAGVHAITCHANALGWRQQQLIRYPAPNV